MRFINNCKLSRPLPFLLSIFALLAMVIAANAQHPGAIPEHLEGLASEQERVVWLTNWVADNGNEYRKSRIVVDYGEQAVIRAEALENQVLLADAYAALGKAYFWYRPEVAKSEGALLKSRNIYLELGDRANEAKSLRRLCVLMGHLNRPEMARDYAFQAVAMGRAIQDSAAVGKAFSQLGSSFYKKSLYDSALCYYQLAAQAYSQDPQLALAIINIGDVHRRRGSYGKAIREYLRAINSSVYYQDSLLQARALNNIGLTYMQMGDYAQSLDYLQQAYEQNLLLGRKRHASMQLLNRSIVLLKMNRYEEASTWMHQNLTLRKELSDSLGWCIASSNLSELHLKTQHIDSAKHYAVQALNLAQALNRPQEVAQAQLSLGVIALQQQALEESLDWLKQAIALSRERSLSNVEAKALQGMGQVYWKKKLIGKASLSLQMALDLYQQQQSKEGLRDTHELLSKIYEQSGQLKQSLHHFQQYKQYYDSIFSEESEKQVANLEVKYEVAITEEENKTLKANNQLQNAQLERSQLLNLLLSIGAILALVVMGVLWRARQIQRRHQLALESKQSQILQQQKELEALNQSKTKMLSILTHDLRAPLSSLNSLLMLVRENVVSPDTFQQRVAALSNKVDNVKSIVEQLLNWAKLQLEQIHPSIKPIAISLLFEQLRNEYAEEAASRNIHLNSELNESDKILADEDMMQIILRNLISNAFKFSPNGSIIKLRATPSHNCCLIEVTDNGTGMEDAEISKLFSLDTVAKEDLRGNRSTGLGLVSSQELAIRMGSKIEVESKVGQGSRFWMILPLVGIKEYI